MNTLRFFLLMLRWNRVTRAKLCITLLAAITCSRTLAAKLDPSKPIWQQDIDLSVEEVILAGLAKSTESQKIGNMVNQLESFKIQATIPYEPQLESRIANVHNRNEPQLPTSPSKIEATEASAKISKRWVTGTTTWAELKQTNSKTTLPAASAPGTSNENSNVETALTVGAIHPLWKNRNGRDLDFTIQKLALQVDTTKNLMQQSYQGLVLQLVNAYLNAWLAQSSIRVSKSRLSKQNELLKVVKITSGRGTTDQSDLLQVESSMLDLRQDVNEQTKKYEDMWRNLLLTLKLQDIYGPDVFKIDPQRIKLTLPNSISRASAICQKKESIDHRQHLSVVGLEKRKSLSQVNIAQAAESDKPELNIEGLISNNAQTTDNSAGLVDTTSGKNPMWTIALSFKMPIGSAPYDSTQRQELYNIKNVEYDQEIQMDQNRVKLENDCFEMYRLGQKESALRKIIRLKTKRTQIEVDDFQIGRSDVFTVIQTENDLTVTRFQLENLKAQRERIAWQILDLGIELPSLIDSYITQAKANSQSNQSPKG